jgi:hypothetical protein
MSVDHDNVMCEQHSSIPPPIHVSIMSVCPSVSTIYVPRIKMHLDMSMILSAMPISLSSEWSNVL